MKTFFGAFFGSLVGLVVATIISIFIVIAMVAGSLKGVMKDGDGGTFTAKPNSVLHFKINGTVVDRGIENPFEDFDFGPFADAGVLGLNDLRAMLKKAETDDNIKGVYLDLQNIGTGFASVEELRNSILEFKKSGKFVYAYSEIYSQKAYYLATAANKVYLNPQGGMEFKGLAAQLMFFKNMLEKLNIEMQIFRHGKFKSAIEPFMLDKMSDANRLQTEAYIGSIWNTMLQGISTARKVDVNTLNALANNLSIAMPEDAVKHKLIDALMYEDEVMDLIRKELKIKEKEKINFVALNKYHKSKGKKGDVKLTRKDKIAVVYAIGQISGGEGDDENIGSERIAKAVRDARNDSTIKAIVLRVNSPGGSALASDVIWREVNLCKGVKPLVVSMGDVAASGGYYISCAADKIYAQPNTITGSIGVFGVLPNARKLFSEKFGITVDTVNTNKHSDLGSTLRGVTEEERGYVQGSVEHIYDVFITRVSDGRKIDKNMVDSIGQGRVWSGADALKINLVDELGGLDAAIAYAVKKAKVGEDYKLVEYPKQKDPFEKLFNKGEEELESRIVGKNLGEQYQYLKVVKHLIDQKGVQARLPYDIIIE